MIGVVTAEGQIVRVSSVENSDLFWGLRGGARAGGEDPLAALGGDFFRIAGALNRLAEVKKQWDPENRFRVNRNIAPA